MKKYILLFVVAVLSASFAYSQTMLGFIDGYGSVNQMWLFPEKDGTFSIHIPIERGSITRFGEEQKITNVRLVIDNNNLDEFVQALSRTKNKFEEWTSVAKKNNVGKMYKSIDVSFPTIKVTGVLSGNRFSANSVLEPSFSIRNNRSSVSFLDVAPSISKKVLDKMVMWAFDSPKEIEELISNIEPTRIKYIISKEKSESDLFK